MITLNDGRELWHTPTPDLPQSAINRLTEFWQSAQKSLFIVDYSFNLSFMANLLTILLQKAVKVTLVLDKSQSQGNSEKPLIVALHALQAKYPDLFILVIGTSSMHQIVHDKFSVVDEVNCEYGSFNFTQAAGKEDNFFFIENNIPVATDLLTIGQSIMEWILQNEPEANGIMAGING